jgi:serine/threonine protein kinase
MSAPVSAREVKAGTVLDERFEIGRQLGKGAFGAVYAARQLVFGKPWRHVALKLFENKCVTAENASEVFADAIVVIGLQEENPSLEIARHLIQVYDIGLLRMPQPVAYVSMKLVPNGRTLENAVTRWKESGGMPVATALKYLRQMLVPLSWMHTLATPVVHGDLKPDNVLMTPASDLVVTDFGLAARMPVGSLGGAIAYQAPETLLGLGAAPAADVYALGLMLYEMLTGKHPFREVGLEGSAQDDQPAFVRAHQWARKWPIRPPEPADRPGYEERIAPASEFNAELKEHPQIEAIIARCLAPLPTERYANALLLLADVDKYTATGGAGLVVDVTTSKDASPAPVLETPEIHTAKAHSLLTLGRLDEALAKVAAALRLNGRHIPALLVQARAEAAQKKPEAAKATCARAREMAPQDPAPLETLADLYRAEGKAALAAAVTQQAKQLREAAKKK